MNDLDFFTPGARLALELECLLLDTRNDAAQSRWWASAHEALEQWRQEIRDMEAAIDAVQPEASTALEQADDHAHICFKLAEQYKSDPVLFAALTDAAAIIRDLMRDRLGASATCAGQAEIEAQQQDKLDAERWRYIRRKLCLAGNGDGTCTMQALNLPAAIQGWPEPGQVAEFCDAAIDAAMRKENRND